MDANQSVDHPPRSATPDWRGYLSAAGSEAEIVKLTRDYVATWLPEDVTRLPDACRPGRIHDGDDISQWAYELASAHCSLRFGEDQDRLLMRMLAFISEAAMRLAEVKAYEAAAAESQR
ncbi:MAG TPA: hypothetical protein VFP44_25230 [Usitatibacter sp.]|nr:hypothetical protein [Usitatibacter sp.]